MALFGRPKEIIFDPGRGTRRGQMPAWLPWIGSGMIAGALCLFFIQENVGPPRLTPAQSQKLQIERDEAVLAKGNAESRETETRTSLQARLDSAVSELEQVRGELARRNAASASTDETIASLRRDVALYEDMLPPDPRGNAVGIRAARFAREKGGLNYHLLLSRRQGEKPFDGTVQMVVSGKKAGGAPERVTLPAVPVHIGDYLHIKGLEELPSGFEPSQTSIRVLDKIAGQQVGMRVINLQ